MELAVVKHIKKYGLDKTIAEFSLKMREYDNVIILKYDQLASPMAAPEVQESRGLILDKLTWEVQAMAYKKFFNNGEGNAVSIDWSKAKILEKLDGSIMMLWWNKYENKWSVSSSGTAFAEGQLADRIDTSFADLFWEVFEAKGYDLNNFDKKCNYIFELCTPYNVIVTPHQESSLTITGVRHLPTMEDCEYELVREYAMCTNVPVVKAFDMSADNFGVLINTFRGMPFSEEGYVVFDGKGRVKVKNPAYVAVHHLTTGSRYNIMGVVKTNEVDEFAAAFGERAEEVYILKYLYNKLIENLEAAWGELQLLRPKNITKEEKKRFATKVFEVCSDKNIKEFTGLMFALENGNETDIRLKIFNMKNKILYAILKSKE